MQITVKLLAPLLRQVEAHDNPIGVLPLGPGSIRSHAMVQPTREDQHLSGHGFVLDPRPADSWAPGIGDKFGRTHQVLGAWIDELDSTRVPGRLDVVDAAPDAAGMDMSPVHATRWIDDRPHGADF